jgi:hypothetical protein
MPVSQAFRPPRPVAIGWALAAVHDPVVYCHTASVGIRGGLALTSGARRVTRTPRRAAAPPPGISRTPRPSSRPPRPEFSGPKAGPRPDLPSGDHPRPICHEGLALGSWSNELGKRWRPTTTHDKASSASGLIWFASARPRGRLAGIPRQAATTSGGIVVTPSGGAPAGARAALWPSPAGAGSQGNRNGPRGGPRAVDGGTVGVSESRARRTRRFRKGRCADADPRQAGC